MLASVTSLDLVIARLRWGTGLGVLELDLTWYKTLGTSLNPILLKGYVE